MSDDADAGDRLRAAEAALVAARAAAGEPSGQLHLAEALLELADQLQGVDYPPLTASGAESLERSLTCVSEVVQVIGAVPDPALDEVVLEALVQRGRLLVFLGRPDETEATTAAMRSRIGDGEQQLRRAEALYEQARDAFERIAEDADASRVASSALERLDAPYADASPPPPDAVVVDVAAAVTMAAEIALSHGQPDRPRRYLGDGICPAVPWATSGRRADSELIAAAALSRVDRRRRVG